MNQRSKASNAKLQLQDPLFNAVGGNVAHHVHGLSLAHTCQQRAASRWPEVRWHRIMAWSSAAGFHQASIKNTRLAACRFNPSPPTWHTKAHLADLTPFRSSFGSLSAHRSSGDIRLHSSRSLCSDSHGGCNGLLRTSPV